VVNSALIDKITSRLEIPQRLRAIVRARESSTPVLMHRLFIHLDAGARLSGLLRLDPIVAISVPLGGGLVFGIARELIAYWRPKREINPIEANALHGRTSLLGSIIVAAETVWSSGVGASVGLEVGYTQFASGIASRIGMAFRLRRADLRILVGCGAADGIAGAFGAPLAGAFYGFELIIGGFSPNSLAPVAVAALIGYLVAHALAPADIGLVAPEKMTIAAYDLVIAATIGLLCAAAGIFLMRGVV
jgi:CIC family chloride channel protein